MKKNKKNTNNFVKPEYVITPQMNNLVKALKDCGYEVEINSGGRYCRDIAKGFSYTRYCTEIIILDLSDSDGDNYEFVFSPKGKRILDFGFNGEYCKKQ